MIQLEIFLFFMSCINLTCDIVLKTFATFKLSRVIIRFVFCSYTMWICSIKSFKVVLIDRFFRHLMNVSSSNEYIFVIHEIFLLMMNFRIFSMMFCHEMWLFIILRLRKRLLIIKRSRAKRLFEENYIRKIARAQSRILIQRWIIVIWLIWWIIYYQKNLIIIEARNFIMKWMTW